MDCAEARRLLDQGITPGAHTSQSSQLGFHLARCAMCRVYRERDDSLLAALLFDTPAVPLREPVSAPTTHVTTQVRQSRTRSSLRRVVGISISVVGIVVLVLLVWLGGVLLRTLDNVAAMTVASTPWPQSTPEVVQPSPQDGVLAAALPLIATTSAKVISVTATLLPSATVSATPLASPTAHATAQTSATVVPSVVLSATPTTIASPDFITLATAVPTTQSVGVNTPVAAPSASLQAGPPPGDAVTILILGNDRRPDEEGVPRTDAIMLARINPRSGRIALLSLPRDLWVTIPGYGASRINAAYVWGETYHADGGGLGLAKATLSELTGVPIDYVVMADFQGFMSAIDSIGGITVNVDTTLDDPQFPTLDYGYTHVHFDPGPQHMDGITALTYSRIRHPDSDFARIKRQQAVLLGLGERLRERGDLQNLLQADAITGALRNYVQIDIPQDRLLGLVWALRAVDSNKVERFALDPSMISFGIGNDRYAEQLLPGAMDALVHQWYGQ